MIKIQELSAKHTIGESHLQQIIEDLEKQLQQIEESSKQKLLEMETQNSMLKNSVQDSEKNTKHLVSLLGRARKELDALSEEVF